MDNATKNRQANKNHFICTVVELYDPTIVIFSCYFDGTQVQAIKYFKSLEKIRAYQKQSCYKIHIRGNSLTIGFDC